MHIDPRKVAATGKAITKDNKAYENRLDDLIETAEKVIEGTKRTMRKLRIMGNRNGKQQDR